MRYTFLALLLISATSAQAQAPWDSNPPRRVFSTVDWIAEHDTTRFDTLSAAKNYFQSFTAAELRVVRNAFFAKDGYKFDSPELESYFETFDWYASGSGDMNLTEAEKANVDLISELEKKKREALKPFQEHFPSRSLPLRIDTSFVRELPQADRKKTSAKAPTIPAEYVRKYLDTTGYPYELYDGVALRAVASLAGRCDSMEVLLYEKEHMGTGHREFFLGTFVPGKGFSDRIQVGEFSGQGWERSTTSDSRIDERYVVHVKTITAEYDSMSADEPSDEDMVEKKFVISLDGSFIEQ